MMTIRGTPISHKMIAGMVLILLSASGQDD